MYKLRMQLPFSPFFSDRGNFSSGTKSEAQKWEGKEEGEEERRQEGVYNVAPLPLFSSAI